LLPMDGKAYHPRASNFYLHSLRRYEKGIPGRGAVKGQFNLEKYIA